MVAFSQLIVAVGIAGAAAALPLLGGCSRPVLVVSAVEGLPRYTPAESRVFSDALSPWIVGVPGETREPSRDPKLIERTQSADAVVRAKIATIADSPDSGFLLDARPLTALAGTPPGDTIELRLAADTRSSALVDEHRHRLIGKTIVLFVRRYDHAGSPRTHWYASVDTQAVVDAVERARTKRDGL